MAQGLGRLGWIALLGSAWLGMQGAKRPWSLMPQVSAVVTSPGVIVSKSGDGLVVTIQPGKEEYPGITIGAPGGKWNLAGYGHVEARLTNAGPKPISLALRVDGDGPWQDNPWNAESVTLQPGQTDTVTTLFGYSFGHRPGYRLNPSSVVRLLLFATRSAEPQSFRVESLAAAGPAGEKPPVAPEDVRVTPAGGVLVGSGSIPDPAKQVAGQGVSTERVGSALRVRFLATTGDRFASIHPPVGRWDLRSANEVRIRLRNSGDVELRPRARLVSNAGTAEWTTGGRLRPGETATLKLPFEGSAPLDLSAGTGGSKIGSDAVSSVDLSIEGAGAGTLDVRQIDAVAGESTPPAWLGMRPPVPGNWVRTLDEEFDGRTLNRSIWRTVGENYYDKVSHWSPKNVVLGGGVVRLRYEKRRGRQNDDAKRDETPYASGYLDTYGLWTQRYGYFEARMKLPASPGLWPAFWMMPDRGPSAGEQWKRQDTASGGMEFDIMEHLTRWGPRRYNVALHYDGYGAEHKSLGTDKVYSRPDRSGFITCGLLWLPGLLAYYCNGREVARWQNPRVSNVPAILMFTLPSGGWDNSPLDDARLPDEFVIDYVRAWRRDEPFH